MNGDAIDRQAVLNYIDRLLHQGTGKKKSFEFMQKFVEKLPPVKPQEPKTDVFDKIRAEIAEEAKGTMNENRAGGLYKALQIIDKHKTEAEEAQEPKTGRWVKISSADIYECSTCGQNVMTQDIKAYKFCHGCGAKMVEPQERSGDDC